MILFRITLIAYLIIFASSFAISSPITDAQRMLNKLGYNAGPVDGAYGKKTRNALEQFYNNKGEKFDKVLSQNEFIDLNQAIKKINKKYNSNLFIDYDFNSMKGAPFCNDPKGYCANWKNDATSECKENYKFSNDQKSTEYHMKFEHCLEEINFKEFIPYAFKRNKDYSPTPKEKINSVRLIKQNWDKKTNIKPAIIATDDVPEIIMDAVKKGLDTSIDILGNFGPLKVFVVGNDISLVEPLIKEFCKWSKGPDEYIHCSKDQGEAMREMAYIYPGGNGFADHSWYLEKPVQTFVHNPLAGEQNEFLALKYKDELFLDSHVAAHEYFHVYQAAHTIFREQDNDNSAYRLPRWMEESNAEYFAWVTGNKNNWINIDERISELVHSVARFRERVPGMSIKDIEQEGGTQRVKNYCGELCIGSLQYEYALIATILLANQTSNDTLFFDFYKNHKRIGWVKAFDKTFRMPVEEFYSSLEIFLKKPTNQQIEQLTEKNRSR
tara:strand:+ start:184 stop:1671 length:1488 start_codon:yes stop_codon:yes gene_type:complete